MLYDAECEYSRQHLAISIASRLTEAGFERITEQIRDVVVKEHLYERGVDGTDLKIQVYTTIVDDNNLGMMVRSTGKDAIRVNVRHPDIKRALVTETRVNRTGACSDIVDRMIERARESYKLARTSGKCHKCGSPRALSKAGKWYCANVCWKTDEEKAKDHVEWRQKNPRRRRRSRFW